MELHAGEAAFVTGAASGIGFALAQAFAQKGMHVALADVDEAAAESAAQRLQARGFEAMPIALDVANRSRWTSALDAAQARLGPITILCNNAGISALGVPVEDMSPEFWELAMRINLDGVFNGSRLIIERMKKNGPRGHIVNTASLASLGLTSPGSSAYAASKYAVLGFSEVLRKELAPSGIGVTVLCPGPVKSMLWRTTRRLRGLPDLDQPPDESLRGSAAPDAMDPELVANRVLHAIARNDAMVITHPEFRSRILDRQAALIAAFDIASQEGVAHEGA